MDCWAPELNTDAGKRAKKFAEDILSRAKELYVTVYLDALVGDAIDAVGKLTTMGRVLGEIWIDEDTTLSQAMVGGFHATKTKPKGAEK